VRLSSGNARRPKSWTSIRALGSEEVISFMAKKAKKDDKKGGKKGK
jgi:hypothetical protein